MSIILKNDAEVLDVRLGYIPEIDERNLNFPMSAAITSDVIRNKTWSCPWFNQLNTSRCVAYSLGHELAATPVAIKNVTDSFMQTLYCEAQKIDPWPGSECGNNPPKYGGTSILAGVKTLQSWGFFKEYRWATNAIEMAKGIYTGPCVIGVRWYADMTHPDSNGFIKPTGALQGGHAIFVRGVNAKGKYFILRNSWGACYDDQTELLTQEGWKYFKNISENETVATLNQDTHELEYHQIDERYEYSYNGDMYNYKSSCIDLSVTPNHKLYISTMSTNTWKLEEAQNISIKHFNMKKDAKWIGIDERFHLIGNTKIPMELWIEFLGYFISEGSTTDCTSNVSARIHKKKHKNGKIYTSFDKATKQRSFTTNISQKKYQNIEIIDKCISALPYKFNKYTYNETVQWTCRNKELFNELSVLGKSYQKYIPFYVKQLSFNLLTILYKALMLGDGSESVCKNGSIKRTYFTSSKLLADDFQELLLKIGYAGDIRVYDRIDREMSNGITKHLEYQIRIKQISTTPHKEKGWKPEIVPYNGTVYCVNVKNHVVFVRRNGNCVWSGNSWGKNGDCYLTFDDMDKLFAQNGECVFFLQRKYKNIT